MTESRIEAMNESQRLVGLTIASVESLEDWGGWRFTFTDGTIALVLGEYSTEDVELRVDDETMRDTKKART